MPCPTMADCYPITSPRGGLRVRFVSTMDSAVRNTTIFAINWIVLGSAQLIWVLAAQPNWPYRECNRLPRKYYFHASLWPDSGHADLLTSIIVDMKFAIIDDAHCEPQGQPYPRREEAIAELERRATIPWNEEPNRAPCKSWAKCGRRYVIEEYDDAESDQISRVLMLEISAKGVDWCRQPNH